MVLDDREVGKKGHGQGIMRDSNSEGEIMKDGENKGKKSKREKRSKN